jgi:hypothetical protein
MTRRLFLGTAFVAAASLAIAGCGWMFAKSYRFRLSVEVDTPQGLRTGSSVYEASTWKTDAILPDEAKRASYLHGEAVAVDLGGGQTLFALLRTGAIHGGMIGLSMTALDPAFNNDLVESAARIAAGKGIRTSAVVAPKDYPVLVRFGDVKNPKSVEAVDAADLAKSFGQGVKLRRITVTLTNDPVTKGIDKRLGWLSKFPEPRLDPDYRGGDNPPNISQKLNHGDFREGNY